MNKLFRNYKNIMIHSSSMRFLIIALGLFIFLSPNLNAEYEMHIPNCTQKGVENCGGFLFDNETGDVLFCGSASCTDLKLPKSWKSKVADKQSKQDQIIEMLSNLQNGSIMKVTKDSKKIVEKKPEVKVKKKEKKKVAKCDKAKKSLCKGTGGMQLGGSKKKKKTE
jgi:hypothetical protein|tara:strand:+ start:1462 stop:1959 length:498 start_codon:yes stop_codon:yes gene_type:complete